MSGTTGAVLLVKEVEPSDEMMMSLLSRIEQQKMAPLIPWFAGVVVVVATTLLSIKETF